MKNWKQWFWVMGGSFLLGMPVAFGDTYHLYFKDGKTVGGPDSEHTAGAPVTPPVAIAPAPVAPPPAPVYIPVPAPQPAPAQPIAVSPVVVDSRNSTPPTPTQIVINNNIQQTVPEPARTVENFSPAVPAISPKRLRATFGLTSFGMATNWMSDDGVITPIAGNGVVLGLSAKLSSAFLASVWGGAARVLDRAHRLHAGAELEFLPIQWSMGSYNLIEFGVLAGVSTLTTRSTETGPLHLGARGNLNFNDSFGLTTAFRVNNDLVFWEGGLVAYF